MKDIQQISRMLASMAISMLAMLASADVLYWQVTEDANVNGGSIQDFVDSYGTYEYEYDGQTYTSYNIAARVKVTGSHLPSPTYLPIYLGGGAEEDGEFGIDLSPDVGGYWGCGAPVGIQTPLDSVGYGTEMFMECSFQIELGNVTWDEVADALDWTTVAKSDMAAATALSQYIHERFDLNPPSLAVWAPMNFYAVPEPDSSLLAMLALPFFILRRKRLEA